MGSGDDPSTAMRAVASEKVAALVEPQPDLLGLPRTERRTDAAKRHSPGRPVGARNKRSEQVARFIVEEIGDPLLVLAQLAVMPAEELAVAANCTTMEALVEKRLAAIAILPFVHRRQPLAVDLTNHSVVHLSIHTGDTASPASGEGGVTLLGSVVTIEENQEVSDAPDAPL